MDSIYYWLLFGGIGTSFTLCYFVSKRQIKKIVEQCKKGVLRNISALKEQEQAAKEHLEKAQEDCLAIQKARDLLSDDLKTANQHNVQMLAISQKEVVRAEELKKEAQQGLQDHIVAIALQKDEAERQCLKEVDDYLEEMKTTFDQAEKELCLDSVLVKKINEIKEVDSQICDYKETLAVIQEQQKKELDKETFTKSHSLQLMSTDLKDIEQLRTIEDFLRRKEAIRKLIWSEFYQKPLQRLCKELSAEKTSGIYKITHIESGKMYIGQAVDIAARWKDHCKNSLGLGMTTYMSNKFYQGLATEHLENFTFEILEKCPTNKLTEKENYWIEFYNAVVFGYNSK